MQIKTFYTKFPENIYAYICDDGIFIVDPGEFTDELKEFVTNNSEKIKYILLTHNHFDHICGVAEIKKICCNAKTVIPPLDAEGLSNPAKSLAAYFGCEQNKTKADMLLNDGDRINLGNTQIIVMHTPGHSKGSVCYLVDNIIFSGDTLFEGSCGRTDFPDGSDIEITASLKKLKDLSGDYEVYPGHGNKTKLSAERIFNPYMRNL